MKQENPPRWSIALFRWFCDDHLCDAVLGDLLEMYDRRRLKMGKLKADLLFVANVIQFIQPFAIRKKNPAYPLNKYDMLKNYITIAWRNMSRQKLYSGITIGGFALGLATCMMIFLFVKNEVSFDKFYKDQDRIFLLYNRDTNPADADRWANVQTPLAGVLRQDLPDIEKIARIMPYGIGRSGYSYVRRDGVAENLFEDRFTYADPDILDILEIPMIFGNTKALDKPYTVVISRSMAKRHFGDIDPVGKVLILGDDVSHPFTVGGVTEDSRKNSHFQFDFIITLKDFEFWPGEQTDWCCWNYSVYIKLKKNVDPADFEEKLVRIRDKYSVAYMRRKGDQRVDDFIKYHFFKLQPVGDIYLHPEISGSAQYGDITYVWMFSGIAIVILILACINFINLSTAKSANRSKEVGIRKVVGSMRRSLITQFLSESTLYSLISFVVAFGIVLITLPGFNTVASRSITIPWTEWWLFPVLISSALMIGVIAGLYPSFYLSSFRPINILKGSIAKGMKGGRLRSAMVVFQFTTSIILIVGTLVIQRQMDYIMNHDVGFNKEQVVIIEGTGPIGDDRRQTFKNELLRLADVENVSVSSYLPVEGGMSEGYGWFQAGREKIDAGVSGSKYRVDPDYIETMRIKLIAGRNFVRSMKSDSMAMIINEAMVHDLALKDPIGTRVSDGVRVYNVIGVIQNFNTRILRAPIRPMGLTIEPGGEGAMAVRVKSNDLATAIQSVESTWRKIIPNQPFRYSFMDERFELMYDDIIRMGRIFVIFTTLAVIVACLGLLALSAFVTEQRAKEISVRRVMGASVQSIFGLLTGNFMKLVFISWIIGTPIAWYAMNEWLDGFSYREPISSYVLIISGMIVGFIALTTVTWQSIKAAVANPVENLRQN